MHSEESDSSPLKYKRVLLKLSGEALMGPGQFGIDIPTCETFAHAIKQAQETGAEICLVIGGGNIFRGVAGAAKGMERAQADSMGMLATIMNALAMQSVLESIGVPTRVQSAIRMESICEPYIRRRAQRHMEKGRVVIFAAGIGNPFFTTDTGAALRAIEMNCDALLKGTQVDGVYTADPKLDANATRYDEVGYQELLAKDLRVMDPSAVSLMRDNNIPIVVFSLKEEGSLLKVLHGKGTSTTITNHGA
ncbi:UMP kinase [Hyphomonas sp.]|jgi:uridylate kinase|uniref:UMP kinase n=1 Tax=Hyphomonas sp. TaxID=87 RepID=UPI000C495571|nr:UMP kinase [Hyphomonadaceae bacterium]MBA28126.1 UMP kinase [Hyphomonadaceae bacterium]MBL4877875.1 UMP kinase [Hyphomonas sp.]HAR60476.1 UMP kinase [Alcanivorax sp.]|tara:strand:+ start:4020 stop:4766 length:747 start_codon:yes stop_codon:yes gene_type:complete